MAGMIGTHRACLFLVPWTSCPAIQICPRCRSTCSHFTHAASSSRQPEYARNSAKSPQLSDTTPFAVRIASTMRRKSPLDGILVGFGLGDTRDTDNAGFRAMRPVSSPIWNTPRNTIKVLLNLLAEMVLAGSVRVPGAGARFDARYAVAQFLHCWSVIADSRATANVGQERWSAFRHSCQ
jgi:hypothetical protein